MFHYERNDNHMAQKLLTDETGQLILQAIKELDTVALNKIGDLTGLKNSNKASLVAAINVAVLAEIGRRLHVKHQDYSG